jgi:class 3 adenylate cyclase
VHGDAVNLAFRLAGLAGRGEVPPVLVETAVAAVSADAAAYDAEFSITVKGRQTPATVRPAVS